MSRESKHRRLPGETQVPSALRASHFLQPTCTNSAEQSRSTGPKPYREPCRLIAGFAPPGGPGLPGPHGGDFVVRLDASSPASATVFTVNALLQVSSSCRLPLRNRINRGLKLSPSVPCFGQLAGAADGRKVRNGSEVSNRSQRAARKAISYQLHQRGPSQAGYV